MYRLMVALDPTRATLVSGGRNEGLNFENVAVESTTRGQGSWQWRRHREKAGVLALWRGSHEEGLLKARRRTIKK